MDPQYPNDPRDKAPPPTGWGTPNARGRRSRRHMRGFARPFLSVIGCYALGLATFSIMAASAVPGGGDPSDFARYAAERTSLIALLAAVAAGRWWR